MKRELPECPPEGDRAAEFSRHRRLLFSIAYRMLGSVADAEDLVQETCVRWLHVPAPEVRAPRAFLVTVLSRLCINHLESARVRREVPVGQSLPEPLLTDRDDDPLGVLRVDESLSMALLILLERLTPVERAASCCTRSSASRMRRSRRASATAKPTAGNCCIARAGTSAT